MRIPETTPLSPEQIRVLVSAARQERARVVTAAVVRGVSRVLALVRTMREIAKASTAARLGNVH